MFKKPIAKNILYFVVNELLLYRIVVASKYWGLCPPNQVKLTALINPFQLTHNAHTFFYN